LLRERAKSRELRPKREWRSASRRESGGWGAGERAAAGEQEREWWPASERESGNW
jgi:hypothetical protein